MLCFLLITIKHILKTQGNSLLYLPKYWNFFLLFHPWHSMFSCGTVYLLFEKCLLICLWRQVCWQWILLMSLHLNVFLFCFLKNIFVEMKFWFARSFLQQFKNVPFVSDLHGFSLELSDHSHPFFFFKKKNLAMLHMPCRILVPWPGTETVSPSVDVWSPNRWMARAFPSLHILMICFRVHWLFSLTFLFCCWSHPVSFKIFSYCTFNYKFLFGFCVSLLFLWWDFLFFIYFERKCWLLRRVLIAALKSLSDYSNITVILVLSFVDSFPI